MSAGDDPAARARQWMQKAGGDLTNAIHTLRLMDECPFDTVCFHAQQCAEKSVKALLVLLDIDFPKTHDLGELIQLLPADLRHRIPLSVGEQEALTDYAVTSRYPGDWEPITREMAAAATEQARRTLEIVRDLLGSMGNRA